MDDTRHVSPPSVDVDGVLAALDAARSAGAPAALAFDGDGTLWAGDVGEDAFEHALGSVALRADPVSALQAQATAHGLDAGGDAHDLCRRLFAAYRAGAFPEDRVCEVMTWCYAGLEEARVRALAREALLARDLGARLVPEMDPILKWARSRGIRTVVISASPRPVVLEAAALWGFGPADVAAATAAVENQRFAPRMATPLPYGAGKLAAGRALLGDANWLGAFGDNVFDLDMLLAASVGIAVRPKPELLRRLQDHPGVLVLRGG